MEVMIGVDPHKGSHTATMLDRERARAETDQGARRAAPGGRAARVG